ncbi:MAG: hypothetical protein M1827_001491 [Pycnora praestabilis]|nr:MAG: hypothetical protein M1827_001491 [Pycnora praestabilis]
MNFQKPRGRLGRGLAPRGERTVRPQHNLRSADLCTLEDAEEQTIQKSEVRFNEDTIMKMREEDVLSARDPSITDDNLWEEYRLSDVKVYANSVNQLKSLLIADNETPLTVSGILTDVEDLQEQLISPQQRFSGNVEISDVRKFAYGQYEDGEVGIWAAGRAGWFEVKPSRKYKRIYNDMVEAIDLLYFLADTYRKTANKKGGRKVMATSDAVFRKYVDHTSRRCADADDAAEIISKHRDFLINSMLRGKEAISWTSTPIWEYFSITFPVSFSLLWEPRVMTEKTKDEVVQVKEKLSREADEATRLATDVDKDSMAHESDEQFESSLNAFTVNTGHRTKAQIIFLLLEDMRNRISHIKVRDLAKALHTTFKTDNLSQAEDIIRARGPELQKLMKQTSHRDPQWSQTSIYKELGQQQFRGKQLKAILALKLRPRTATQNDEIGVVVISDEQSEDEDLRLAQTARKGKSVLRPKSSKFSNKGAGKRGRPSIAATDEDNNSDEAMEDINPSRPKRQKDRKRSAAAIEDDNTKPTDDPLPLRLCKPSDNDANVHPQTFHIVEEALPSYTPQGPGDTWTCTLDGCVHKVYAGSTPAGQVKIRDHFREHASERQEQLDLVFKEQRPHLPVANLLGRIREVAALQTVPVGGKSEFPKPIRRRF